MRNAQRFTATVIRTRRSASRECLKRKQKQNSADLLAKSSIRTRLTATRSLLISPDQRLLHRRKRVQQTRRRNLVLTPPIPRPPALSPNSHNKKTNLASSRSSRKRPKP